MKKADKILHEASIIINEAKQTGDDTEFESCGGGFNNRGVLPSMSAKGFYSAQPGTYAGGKKPRYIIKADEKDLKGINTKLNKMYKKIGDMIDKMMVSELKKIGFTQE